MRLFFLNPFLNPLSKCKPLLIIQMAPPKYLHGKSVALLSQTESMFSINNDFINVDIKNTKIPSKDLFAKRLNGVNIISIDENLITAVFAIF